jgi:nitrite reductase/ring-hydroxylating ferredoxin subunit
MSSENVEVYVVCRADSIERGDAKAFSLSRLTEEGEGKPFSIVLLRTMDDQYFGYVNTCPHQGTWLNIGDGTFFSEDKKHIRCGRHKAKFEIDTGLCIEGPCEGRAIEQIPIVNVDGELCLCGVALAEEDGSPFEDTDDTMEIMIHPD